MKKALSLLLVLAMLATLCTVPVFAEDETLDLPFIEEVTEEEMEEEVELFGEVEGTNAIVNIATSENDGITLLTELDGFDIDISKANGKDGDPKSLYNGKITVGDNLGEEYVTDGETKEGVRIGSGGYFTLDLGAKRTFSGIRVYDTSMTRYCASANYSEPIDGKDRIKTALIQFSDDNKNWYEIAQATAVHNAEGCYSDLGFRFNGAEGNCLNLSARYIRFMPKRVVAGNYVGFEEIVMLDPIAENCPTWSLTGYEIPTSEFESVEAGSTWQKDTNPTSYPVTKAYDNSLVLNSLWHSDHALGDKATDNDRSITIKLKNVTKIGGVRIWPRNAGTMAVKKDATGSVRKVQIFGAGEDGAFYPLTAMSSDYHSTWNSVGYSLPRDIIISDNIDAEVKYIKIVAGYHGDVSVGIPEFQLLGEGVKKGSRTGYAADTDVVRWSSLPTFKGVVNTSDNKMESKTGAFDGIVYQTMNTAEGYYNDYGKFDSSDPHMGDWHVKFSEGNTSYMEFDLETEYTFSAIRLFGRWNQSGQAFTKGYILVGDGNGNWYRTEGYSDSYSNSASGMAKYNSTGDCYTDIPVKFDDELNITARYIRIFCEDSGGHSHWSWQEMMLVKPDSANETYTVSQLAAAISTDVSDVEALIETIPDEIVNYDEETVDAAKAAYDALGTAAKEKVNADAASKLEAAVAAKAALTYSMPVTGNKGYTPITFTIPKRENTTVKAVTYETTLGTTIDGLSATTVTPDEEGDTMTVTFAGNYTGSTGLVSYVTSRNNYYGKTNSTYSWIIKGNPIVPEDFVGIFPRLVAGDGFGDHIINVTFGEGEDEVTYTFNLNTTPVWRTLTDAKAISGSDYTDEITPGTNWKVTASNGGDLASAFDGVAEYILRREELAAWEAGTLKKVTTNRYESNYVAGYVSAEKGKDGFNTVLLYVPVRMDFVVDMGTEITFSGARFYPRINASVATDKDTGVITSYSHSWNADKTKGNVSGCPTDVIYWGSNNGRSWTEIGRYQFSKDGCGERTAIFDENITCRYLKVSVLKANGTEYNATINISEFALLKPQTLLIGDDATTVDVSEGGKAEFTFDLIEGDSLASLKDAKGADVAYTFEDGVLTIDNAYLAALANGTYKFTATFSCGNSFELSVVKNNSSDVKYILYGSNVTGNLVLNNPSGKEVTSLTYENGKGISKFTLSEDNKTITVIRQHFRQSYDLFATTDIGKAGEVKLTANYADGSSKTYTITVDAEWSTTSSVGGTYAADEIYPDVTKWKARVSSANGNGAAIAILTAKKINVRDSQNWHTFFSKVNGTGGVGDSTGAQGHWLDIDFGENPAPYIGFRHLERPDGSRWVEKALVIMGKNSPEDQWTTIYNEIPTYTKIGEYNYFAADSNDIDGDGDVEEKIIPAVAPIYEGDFRFEDEVTYRYIRMHIFSGSHTTADTLHVLKKMATVENAEVLIDKTVADNVEFTFDLSSVAAGEISVAAGEETVAAENYTFDKATGKLSFTADYAAALPEGETVLTVTIDGWANEVTIEKLDKLTKTYALSDIENGKGDYELKLKSLNNDTVTAVMYGEKNVEFTVAEGEIVIERHKFRLLDKDFFLKDSAELKVTYEIAGDVTYTVNFTVAEFTVNNEGGAFEADEIVPVYGTWKAKLSSSLDAVAASRFFGKKDTTDFNWHSAYIDKNGAAIFENDTGYHYAEIDFGAETKFSGIRYAGRESISGDWTEVKLMGSNDGGETWEEILPWTKTGINSENRVSTIKLEKNVSYKKVRFCIHSGGVATGKFVTFLKPVTVNVNMTPTTGGNITTGGNNVQGTITHEPGEKVTYTATPEDGNKFMYWIEANTGKVLGYEEGLKLQTTVGKNIQAVFAEVGGDSPYVGFFGRNGLARLASGNINKDKTLGEQTAITIPRAEKLYQTGYNFAYWMLGAIKYTAEEILGVTVEENSDFVAVYEKDKEKTYAVVVEGGTVSDGSEKFPYNTAVTVVANKVEGKEFNYWTIDGQIVSYAEEYTFYMPDTDITVVAVFGDSKVEEEITMSMTCTKTTVKNAAGEDVPIAGFITSRNIPENTKILETGIIYVKDASYGELTISSVGEKSANDKEVKVAIAAKNGEDENGEEIYISGQHKLSASYSALGIKARGFITYMKDGVVKTIYTSEIAVKDTQAE